VIDIVRSPHSISLFSQQVKLWWNGTKTKKVNKNRLKKLYDAL